ncbi:unnamed protein product [Paramecium pentaurelia]|uniref:Transmembrane protein n=2 Tax=Paramecium pentaurelia TaxID=43138 RepID=A0A8S1Y0R9_9CILI|nr:unnamed protein product [Paramecium pentaurelia]
MKIDLTLFCLILYTFASSCVSNLQQYDIFATENETLEWDMNAFFFTGENIKFNVKQESNFFEVLSPLHQLGQTTNALDLKIVSLKPLLQIDNGAWTNVFAALGLNQTCFQVLFSKDGILNQVKVPNFNESIKLRDFTNDFACYDLDFITETKVVIDCSLFDSDNPQNNINGFFIVDIDDEQYFGIELIENTQDYNDTQYRIISFHNYTFYNKDDQNLVFRSEPAWATKKALQQFILEKNSKIEVFQFTSKFTLLKNTPVAILTNAVLAKLLGIDEDFKIEANGRVNILDAYNGFYVVSFKQKFLEWNLEDFINISYKSLCFGFDIHNSFNKDGTLTKKVVFVYQNTLVLLENGLQSFQLLIPKIDWYNAFQIKLSQQYIILKIRNTIHIFNIENGKKIFTQVEDASIIITNPNYEDVIGINSQTAKRYFLNNGLLRLNRPDKASSINKFVTLSAEIIDDPSKRCSVTLNLLVLKKNDTQILSFNNNPFNPIIIIPSNPIILKQIASGPNLQYSSIDLIEDQLKSKISYKIKQVIKLQITNIHMPGPKDIIYSDILVNENPAEFYLLLQVQSRIVYIYSCQHQYQNFEIAECLNYNTFAFPSIIDQHLGFFSWFTIYSQLVIIHQNSKFSINIYSLRDGQMRNIYIIEFDDKYFENQISSVAIIFDSIYIVQSGIKRVSIYQLYSPFRLLYEINQNDIQKFDMHGIFTPIKVFGNKSNILAFIQTQTSLLIGMFSKIQSPSFVIHKVIPILDGSDVEVAIGINSFFVLQTLKGEDHIEEYQYQHLQNIYKLKDIPLFNYKLQKPLTVDYSFQTGWFYVRASDGLQTVILVYQPNVLSHISLYKVLDTEGLVKDGLKFNMAVDGGDQMFLYYNNNTHHQIISILSKSQLYVTPNPDYIEYVNNQIIAVQISGFQGVRPITQQSLVTLLNTQIQLFIQQSLFDSKKKVFPFVKQSGYQFISMGTDWYQGQVTSFNIKCSQCFDSLSILPNIYKVRDGNFYGQILDGASFGLAGQVYLTKNSLIFEDITGLLKLKILINLKTESCHQISISADYTFILSAFQNTKNEAGLFIHKCQYQDACSQFRQGIEILKGLQMITKTKMPDQKNIIILNLNNFIVVASLDDYGTIFTISHKYIINNYYVGSNQLLIGDFDVIKYSINSNLFATILFTDINNGIYFSHFAYNDQGLLFKTTYELFKLINFSDDQFFINQDTKFYQVKVISSQLNGNILQLNVLISTNNQAQYVFAFDLDASKPTFGLPIKKSSVSLLYVLTPYGDWPAINKLAYIDGNVAIPYTDGKKIVIGIYQLSSGRPSSVKFVPFTHSISKNYNRITPEQFFMIFNRDTGSTYPQLYINIDYDERYDEYLVEYYKMRSDPQIVLKNSTNYQNELVIELYLNNDFNQIQGQAILQSNSSIMETNIGIINFKFLN